MPSSPPRLVILAHASVLDRGGYARRVVDCARTLRATFADASIRLLSVESPTRRADRAAVAELTHAVTAFGAELDVVAAWPRRRGFARISDALAARAVARRLRNFGADRVHAHGPRAAATALRATHGTGVRVVVDVHGDRAAEARLERGTADDASTPTDLAESRVVALADGAIYASEALSRRFPAPRDAPTGVVACVVDASRVRSDADAEARRAALRRTWGLSGDEWIAAYAGSLATWQEIPRVVAVARHLTERVPQFRLLFLTPERERATALLRAGGLPSGSFRVLSPPPNEVVDTLSAADAGLLLRRPCVANAVAFPTKAAEYLAAGLSIVTTDAVEAIVGLVSRRPIAGIVVPWSVEDDVLAARLAGESRPDSPAERAARRAIVREELSSAAAVPVYRRVYDALDP